MANEEEADMPFSVCAAPIIVASRCRRLRRSEIDLGRTSLAARRGATLAAAPPQPLHLLPFRFLFLVPGA